MESALVIQEHWKKVLELLRCLIRIVGMTAEFWKTISGFPAYQVSSLGNIQSCLERKFGGVRGCRMVFSKNYHPIKPLIDRIGRRFVTLYSLPIISGEKAIKKRHLIAKIVLCEFVSQRPKGMIVRHGGKGHSDDSVSNLSWGTYSENNGIDRHRDGTALKGNALPWTKLSPGKVIQIRSLITYGSSEQDIAKMFNVTRRTINYIKNRDIWKWLDRK